MRPCRPPRFAPLAAALAGLLLGACGGTLYDAAGVPPLPSGGVTCDPPQHVCGGTCVAQSVAACGDGCATCAATDPNADPVCEQQAVGAWACGQVCRVGWLPCATGCCLATAVAAGDDHACAVTSDGGLACWGKNDAGQLGPGAAGVASTPHPVVVPVTSVTAVAAGGRHTCAVVGGTVKCWGANEAGQLGDGSTVSGGNVVSTGLSGATSLALGARHSCAIVGTGPSAAVECWGANDVGQLGTGDLVPHPAHVPSLITAGTTALSAAGDDTCAVASGKANCWGLDLEGQTGSGSTAPWRPTPVVVPLSSTTINVVAGRKHACGTSTGGGTPLYCWGSGGEQELGNGLTTTPQLTPVQASKVDPNKLASIFSAGEAFTCSVAPDPVGMQCAGRNDQAQCGLAPSSSAVTSAYVSFGGSVLAATAGRAFTCALVNRGGSNVVMCWGSNLDGQLGRSTDPATSSATPLPVEN